MKNIGTTSLLENYNAKDNDTEEIDLEKLDNLYNYENKKLIIKIDVEGYEKFVIEGSLNLFNNNKVLMYLETLDKYLLNKLKNLNFNIFFPKFSLGKGFSFSKVQRGHDVILKNF